MKKLLTLISMAAVTLLLSSNGSAQCLTASVGGSWQTTGMTTQVGTFVAAFDVTPSASPTNSVVALSSGVQTAYAGYACLVRFNSSGTIDARNGGAYAAAATVPYSANSTYHIRLVVYVPNHTYSIFVTPSGGGEITLGSNYAFRTEQSAVTSLDTCGVYVDAAASGGAGTNTECDLAVAALPSSPIAIRALANNQYVSAANSTTSLIANSTVSSGAAQQFDVIDLGNGNIALLAHSDNLYVTAENAGASPLIANRTAVGGWETFQAVPVVGGVALEAAANGAYVCADNAGASALIANRTTVGTWETYVFENPSVSRPAATPYFTPGGGTYSGAQTVTITSASSGTSIRYTTDGSTPSETAGTVYAGPVTIASGATLQAIAYGSGFTASGVAGASYTISSGGALTGSSSGGFATLGMSSTLTGTFTVTFDATPSASPENAVIGLSKGAATTYGAMSCLVRFNPSGDIDAYNGTGYAAALTIPYAAGVSYHFRLVVNVPANTYSVYVTPAGGSELAVGLDYGFRIAQASLDTWDVDVNATPAGCALAANNLANTASPTSPNFGPNVLIFDPGMSSSSIQTQVDNIYSQQHTNQFGSARYAFLFKPGSYSNTVQVGYYTQVLGLGQSPDDVTITGAVSSSAALSGNNATCNFWEGVENLAVIPTGGTDKWAVSQGCPMRRVHIKGSIILDDSGGWASGGFLSDSLIDNQINSGTQQQWLSRNSQWGSWAGSNWNIVFVGDSNAPSGANWPSPAYTVINQTPLVREKPFVTIDGNGMYGVFVPGLRSNSQGTTWASGPAPGQTIPISQFYIAKAATDTAATINAALSQGYNLLLTPGVYSLTDTIRITNPNTVVLGLGIATLLAQNGVTAMTVADVDGVKIAGILFDAGATSSPILLQVGPTGSSVDHSANPTCLFDLFFRVGGAAVGQAAVSLQINSNDVIGDDFWVWRADHSNGVGWNTNVAANGLVVNGANVTIYGLAVEHYQQYQTLWNGNGGSVYFYQSEAPYDVPNQASWMAGSENGYASYKVANTVTSHQAYGVGVYCYFNVNTSVKLNNAIEVPTAGLNGLMLHNMTTVSLGGKGEITHVIDGFGGSANATTNVVRLAK